MSEKQLQFRVGLFVLVSFVVIGVMTFQFGEFRGAFSRKYNVHVHFDSAPGILEGSPVKMNGIPIGTVKELLLDNERGGVLLILGIDEKYPLRSDSQPTLQQSILGDATVEFTPGISADPFDRNSVLEGVPPFDMMAVVQQLEQQTSLTMASFEETSREWQLVAKNINGLVDTNRGNLHDVINQTANSLAEFTTTMKRAGDTFDNANRVIGDPQTVANLRKALSGLPQIVGETQLTISAMRKTVTTINSNLANIEKVTEPLGKHTTSIVVRLDNSLANLEVLTKELRMISQAATRNDGSFQKFLSDPTLYRNLERSSAAMSVLLQNLNPVIKDLRVFSDKVARHPELIGVAGAISPSSGLKNGEGEIKQTGFQE
jgi:phospholipid/cholesterol/gamma-HCH transport system substrate-binding protein